MPVAADFIDSVQGAAFAGDDVIGGFAPDERLWLGVVEQEIIVDGRVQIIEAGIAFPANASRGDLGKEPFDQVQPRREGRREGPLEAGRDVCPTRPSPQASCGGIVIQHRMHRPSALNRAVDMAQELQEFFGPVTGTPIAEAWEQERRLLTPLPAAMPDPFDVVVYRPWHRLHGKRSKPPLQSVPRAYRSGGSAAAAPTVPSI